MDLRPKRVASRLMTRSPVYRVIPSGALRTYAALRYHAETASADELAAYLQRSGMPAARYAATALIAARGAFRTGQDEALTRILGDARHRFPERAGFVELEADLAAFRGEHAQGLSLAKLARLLDPASASAASLEVRLSYLVLDEQVADDVGLRALERFPNNAAVLWAVAKACRSSGQYDRIVECWRDRTRDAADLGGAVRQLATAAGRAARTDDAIDWYRRAFHRMLEHGVSASVVRGVRLEGKGSWNAVIDLVELLDGAGIPYFFAAGTTLGLIREGRPLSADDDIDVGIFDEDLDLDVVRELFRSHPRFDFDAAHPHSKKLGLKHRGGSPVDVFRFYEEDGRVWHDAVFVRWHNRPFGIERIEVQGVEVPIPTDVDRYLTESYGDWRTPNSSFDAFLEEAPNVEITWPEYHRLHLVRRAYQAFVEGDMAEASAFLDAAGEGELADQAGGTHA